MAAGVLSEVAAVSRMIARMGLVEAFGHVSARRPEGGFAITPTRPLGAVQAGDVIELQPDAALANDGGEGRPLEAPLHAGVYGRRPDVGAACRTHSHWAAAWAASAQAPPVAHGLGGLSGEVAVHRESDLVTTAAAAGAAAADLGDADCLLLEGNGALCTGPDLPTACVRAWFLEERCRVASEARGRAIEGSALEARARHFPAETERAWRWLVWRFGDEEVPPMD